MRLLKKLTACLLLSGLIAACSPPSAENERPDPVLKLMVASEDGDDANATMAGYRDTTMTLKVLAFKAVPDGADSELYSNEELGAVEGQTINWKVKGGAEQFIKMSDTKGMTQTDQNGISAMDVTIDPETRTGTYQITAYANDEAGISFTIRVKDLELSLEIDGSNSRTMGLARSDLLRVFVKNQTGGGVAGQEVKFTIVDGQSKFNDTKMGFRSDVLALSDSSEDESIRLGTDVKLDYSVITNNQGIADVYFFTGVLSSSHTIQVAVDGVEAKASHNVAYNIIPAVDGKCTNNDDCSYSEICNNNGTCSEPPIYCSPHDRPDDVACPGSLTCSDDKTCQTNKCDTNDDCNYSGGQVQACDSVLDTGCSSSAYCSEDQTCQGNVCHKGTCLYYHQCTTNDDCTAGWKCAALEDPSKDYCVPWDYGVEPLKVNGIWYTKYNFNLSDILGIFGSEGAIGEVINFMRLMTGEGLAAQINIAVLGDVIEGIVKSVVSAYVPEWIPTLISALSDFISSFEDMDAEGTMTINQPKVAIEANGVSKDQLGTYLVGAETWDKVILYLPSLPTCANGRWSANYPECAKVDVAVDAVLDGLDYSDAKMRVGVFLSSFEGTYKLAQDANGEYSNDGATVELNNRKVKLAIRSLIINLLDLVTVTASNNYYTSFDQMICKAVDLNTTTTDNSTNSSAAAAATSTDICDDKSLGGWMCGLLKTGVSKLVAKMYPQFANTDFSMVQSICELAAKTAASSLDEYLKKMTSELEINDMTATGEVMADPNKATRAIGIGIPVNGTDVEGDFSGTTNLISRPLSGTWGASRDRATINGLSAQ